MLKQNSFRLWLGVSLLCSGIVGCGSETRSHLEELPEQVSFTGALSKVRYDAVKKELLVKGYLTDEDLTLLLDQSSDSLYQQAVIRLFEWTNRDEETRKGVMRVGLEMSLTEVFQPAIDSFESFYPNAKVIIHPMDSDQSIALLKSDEIRFALCTRGLNAKDSIDLGAKLPSFNQVALFRDALVFITHPTAPQSGFEQGELDLIFSGQWTNWKDINPTVKPLPIQLFVPNDFRIRHLENAILSGKLLTQRAALTANDDETIEMVRRTPGSIGMISLMNTGAALDVREAQRDTTQFKAIGIVLSKLLPPVKPYQANVLMNKYPYVYSLFAVFRSDLGLMPSGLSQHLRGGREGEGQLLGYQMGLVPLTQKIKLTESPE